MPIEIKELVIRGVAESQPRDEAVRRESNEADVDFDALVEACVQQVMRILSRSGER